MKSNDPQKLTRLVGGPKDGEKTERKPESGKIKFTGAGFTAPTHSYKMIGLLDADGGHVAVFEDKEDHAKT